MYLIASFTANMLDVSMKNKHYNHEMLIIMCIKLIQNTGIVLILVCTDVCFSVTLIVCLSFILMPMMVILTDTCIYVLLNTIE